MVIIDEPGTKKSTITDKLTRKRYSYYPEVSREVTFKTRTSTPLMNLGTKAMNKQIYFMTFSKEIYVNYNCPWTKTPKDTINKQIIYILNRIS